MGDCLNCVRRFCSQERLVATLDVKKVNVLVDTSLAVHHRSRFSTDTPKSSDRNCRLERKLLKTWT